MLKSSSALGAWRAALAIVITILACIYSVSASAGERALQGKVSLPNSGAEEAQEAFLYGLTQLHNFQHDDAAAAFREAQQIDPGFAMAYWGEAMTYNYPVWADQDRDAAIEVLQRLAVTPQLRQAKAATQREKDYLHAIEILYGEGDKHQRDFAYSAEMARLYQIYPDDQELASFYALSILGTAHQGRDFAIYMRAAAVVQEVFRINPDHPGAAHYLIHSFDDPVHAPLGLRAALLYSEIAPNASHAQHMTSHIFLALGRWPDVVRANQRAIAVSNRARQESGRPQRNCGHYDSWLAYAYERNNNSAAAIEMIRNCHNEAKTTEPASPSIDVDTSALHSFLYMRARYLIDTQDWNGEIAALTIEIPDDLVPETVTWEFIEGLGAARRGELSEARRHLMNLNEAERAFRQYLDVADYDASRLEIARPGILMQQLEGLIRFTDGDQAGGIKLLQAAADAEALLPMAYGPPVIEQPSYELLATALLAAGETEQARRTYALADQRTPGRQISHQTIN